MATGLAGAGALVRVVPELNDEQSELKDVNVAVRRPRHSSGSRGASLI